jgi:hypothetical protein
VAVSMDDGDAPTRVSFYDSVTGKLTGQLPAEESANFRVTHQLLEVGLAPGIGIG